MRMMPYMYNDNLHHLINNVELAEEGGLDSYQQ
jgi:hypothetical protein